MDGVESQVTYSSAGLFMFFCRLLVPHLWQRKGCVIDDLPKAQLALRVDVEKFMHDKTRS